jgi:hypothetical protein
MQLNETSNPDDPTPIVENDSSPPTKNLKLVCNLIFIHSYLHLGIT